MGVTNLISDLATTFLAVAADIQRPKAIVEKATGFDKGLSIFILVAEGVAVFTSAPVWYNAGATVLDWVMWAGGALGTALDTTWFILTEMVSQLANDVGIVTAFILGLGLLGTNIYYVVKQTQPMAQRIGDILPTLPLVFKPLRLSVIPEPFGFAGRLVLACVDLCTLFGGIAMFVANLDAIAPKPQGALTLRAAASS